MLLPKEKLVDTNGAASIDPKACSCFESYAKFLFIIIATDIVVVIEYGESSELPSSKPVQPPRTSSKRSMKLKTQN
ncbi:hypothetical protein RIF29_29673 [Crotalaria pallida]|uniref:Uncharacterized protein n=1 Tax=Crotalaria pallida TaxID=3830 RepID=A0AAN9EFW4_CROPI